MLNKIKSLHQTSFSPCIINTVEPGGNNLKIAFIMIIIISLNKGNK